MSNEDPKREAEKVTRERFGDPSTAEVERPNGTPPPPPPKPRKP